MALIAHDRPDAETFARTAEQLLDLEAHQYHHIASALEEEIGVADAREVLADALSEYGAWRGQRIASRHDRVGTPRTVTNLITNWGSGDLHGVLELGWGAARGDDSTAEITVSGTPDVRYLERVGRHDLALLWWHNVLEGVMHAYFGSGMNLTTADRADAVISALRSDDERPVPDTALSSAVFAQQDAAHSVIRETIDNRAAQLALLGRHMISRYDASGEHALRVGVQRFGAERGKQLRERHLARGLEPHLKQMIDDFDYGGESVWKFRGSGELTPQRWHQDCTYCPFAVVWRELDAMDLGYLYDLEFHVAQFKAYHPGIRVRWDKLQTRGDAVCAFRFDLPESSMNGMAK